VIRTPAGDPQENHEREDNLSPAGRRSSSACYYSPGMPSLRLLPLLLVVLAAASCANVHAYERASLAHPSMTASDLVTPAEDHVRAVQEGAIGGGSSVGGGCGCN
jgi:Domain of unknown function (DUF4266)